MNTKLKTTAATAALSLGGHLVTSGPALADNPIVQTNYTADPAPMVHDGTLYVYTSHDEDVTVDNFYTMNDWRLYSTEDMVNWTDHGSPAGLDTFSWSTDSAWAPQGIARNGQYYLYVPLNNNTGARIGVGVSENIAGPFMDPLGRELVQTGTSDIDPTVFIDDDDQAYMYWGNATLQYVRLNPDMVSYSGSPTTVSMPGFTEGPWLYKRESLYYMVYAGMSGTEKISYATSDSPTGPWNARGDIMAPGVTYTNHAGIVDYKGHSYFFYHNSALPGGNDFKRSVCVEEFTYGADGSIPQLTMSAEGPAAVDTLNPFEQVEAETIAFSSGLKTEVCTDTGAGMNVTSISVGDYIKVKGVDFQEGVTSFQARVASSANDAGIELRLDSQTGPVLGSCDLSGASEWTTKSCPISGASGTHDLFLTFTGSGDDLFKFNWWQFAPVPTETEDGGAGGGGGTEGMNGAGGQGGADPALGTGGSGAADGPDGVATPELSGGAGGAVDNGAANNGAVDNGAANNGGELPVASSEPTQGGNGATAGASSAMTPTAPGPANLAPTPAAMPSVNSTEQGAAMTPQLVVAMQGSPSPAGSGLVDEGAMPAQNNGEADDGGCAVSPGAGLGKGGSWAAVWLLSCGLFLRRRFKHRPPAVAGWLALAATGLCGCASEENGAAGDEPSATSTTSSTSGGSAAGMSGGASTGAPSVASPANTPVPPPNAPLTPTASSPGTSSGAGAGTNTSGADIGAEPPDGEGAAGGGGGDIPGGVGQGSTGAGGGNSDDNNPVDVGAGGSGGADGSDMTGEMPSGAGGEAGDMDAGADGAGATNNSGEESMISPNSPGCGSPISRPDRNQQQTMEVGGATRYYLLDVPQGADNQTPLTLIFGLHGFDMNNVAVKDLYNFTTRSNGQAITVMPQGEGPPPGDVSHWGDGVLESTWVPNQANFDYIRALIDSLGESYCIDRNRVFIVGFSMGAFFTNAIACEHNDWFRGFAPIAGGGPSGCGDGIQSAIMIQHGTEDPIVEISSGMGSRDIWLEQNGCGESSTPVFNGCERFEGCPDGKPVVWCTGNYDHYIPEQVVANIWSFFSEL